MQEADTKHQNHRRIIEVSVYPSRCFGRWVYLAWGVRGLPSDGELQHQQSPEVCSFRRPEEIDGAAGYKPRRKTELRGVQATYQKHLSYRRAAEVPVPPCRRFWRRLHPRRRVRSVQDDDHDGRKARPKVSTFRKSEETVWWAGCQQRQQAELRRVQEADIKHQNHRRIIEVSVCPSRCFGRWVYFCLRIWRT